MEESTQDTNLDKKISDNKTQAKPEAKSQNPADKKTNESAKSSNKAENKTENKAENKTENKTENKKPSKKNADKAEKSSSKLAVVNFVLILVIAGFIGYLYYLFYFEKEAFFSDKSQELDKNSMAITQNFSQKLEQEVIKIQANKDLLEKLAKSDAKQNSALADALNKIESQKKIQSEDWRLAEIEYLLNLANQELLLAKDAKSALRLLQSAYVKLDNLSLAASLPIMQALKSDITNLTSLHNKKLANISVELLALTQTVANLQILEKMPTDSKQLETNQTQEAGFLHKAWQELKSLVIIKKHKEAIKPILTDADLNLDKQRILLLLNQASWASLRKDNLLYSKTLEQAMQILQTGFNASLNKDVEFLLAKLKELKNTDLEIPIEKYSKGLAKLEEFMLSRYQLPLGQKNSAAKTAEVPKTKKIEKIEKIEKTEKTKKDAEATSTKNQPQATQAQTQANQNQQAINLARLKQYLPKNILESLNCQTPLHLEGVVYEIVS